MFEIYFRFVSQRVRCDFGIFVKQNLLPVLLVNSVCFQLLLLIIIIHFRRCVRLRTDFETEMVVTLDKTGENICHDMKLIHTRLISESRLDYRNLIYLFVSINKRICKLIHFSSRLLIFLLLCQFDTNRRNEGWMTIKRNNTKFPINSGHSLHTLLTIHSV